MKKYISKLIDHNKLILNTQFIIIIETQNEYRVFLAMADGEWVEHKEFQKNLMGLTNALQLATECCAGKFYLKTATIPKQTLEHKE